MNQEDSWLDKLSQRLDDYEEPLPADGWEQLQQSLQSSAEPTAGNKKALGWRSWRTPLAVAAMLAILFGAGFWFLAKDNGMTTDSQPVNELAALTPQPEAASLANDTLSQEMPDVQEEQKEVEDQKETEQPTEKTEQPTEIAPTTVEQNLIAQNIQPEEPKASTPEPPQGAELKPVADLNDQLQQRTTEPKVENANTETQEREEEVSVVPKGKSVKKITNPAKQSLPMASGFASTRVLKENNNTTDNTTVNNNVASTTTEAYFSTAEYQSVESYLNSNFKPEQPLTRSSYKLTLTIEADGKVSEIKFLNLVKLTKQDYLLVQTLKNMPKWQPKVSNGVAQKSNYTFTYNIPTNN